MKSKLISVVVMLLFASMIFSGCEEEAIISEYNVVLESDVVEFVNISFEKEKNREGIFIEAKLTWLFHNIADRLIDVGIDFEFYDINDGLVYSETKTISQMPSNYTERFSPVYNTITLTGDEAKYTEYVVVKAYEI